MRNHTIFGKDVLYQVMGSSAWLVVIEGKNSWAYTNDKRKCLNTLLNQTKEKINHTVDVESVSSYDMISLLDHFHCSVKDTNKFRRNVIR